MRIDEMFTRDIHRAINGVVKADQLDDSSVWQELDEFVITHELDGHLRKFFSIFLDVMDRPNDPDINGKIGVWVSGFFGSGKSHFIKVLSYLLENREHRLKEAHKRAIDFFKDKVADPMLFADMKRAVNSNADVVLFNIDSKADRSSQNALLQVFFKVFNELQGYSPDYPHIANMERYLEKNDKLDVFKEQFQQLTGSNWLEERDAYEFNRDYVLEALSHALGQSQESLEKWIDTAHETFPLTIEGFATYVKEYLDAQDSGHKIVFIVDEIGQFIGGDVHLMLNLQTIVEELGSKCQGRAWVVVTSQEDIDAVLGEVRSSKNDFSKIQGRFATRLSLSGSNVDEVIQERLLAKKERALNALRDRFVGQGDIIKNHITFSNIGTTFKTIQNADDFALNYPFVPYQFKLLQRIFESIRVHGVTGLHLAHGERSLLDAFQTAAKQVAAQETGVLVPLYLFYPAIESFLESMVKRTIDHAAENASLEDFDCEILKVLFLIRHVDEMKGNLDNLVTLCLPEIDADRHALRRDIEASVQRLENQSLISRNADVFQFLTNEEQDVQRAIQNTTIPDNDRTRLLSELIFRDLLKDQRKHRYAKNGKDFEFNRRCDQYPFGNQIENALVVSMITPFHDDYDLYNDSRCIMESTADQGAQLLIRLKEDIRLHRELQNYLKTKRYINVNDSTDKTASLRKIHSQISDENRARYSFLSSVLGDMITEATFYACGNSLRLRASAPQALLFEALDYLIDNAFTKMAYLEQLCDQPEKEMQATLQHNDIGQMALEMEEDESNPRAMQELRDYIRLCHSTSKEISLHAMIVDRFGKRPYGWPEMETALLVARLLARNEIQLLQGGDAKPREACYDLLTSMRAWRTTIVRQRELLDPRLINQGREIAKNLFAQMAPDGEDALVSHVQHHIGLWWNDLRQWKASVDAGNYPGKVDIEEGLDTIKRLQACQDNKTFLQRFQELREDLDHLAQCMGDLRQFHDHQRRTWDRLRTAYQQFQMNRLELERDPEAKRALQEMANILQAARPYGLLFQTEELIHQIAQVNDVLVAKYRDEANTVIQRQLDLLRQEAEKCQASQELTKTCLDPLDRLQQQLARTESIAHLIQFQQEAERHADEALKRLEEAALQPESPPTHADEGDSAVAEAHAAAPPKSAATPPKPKPRRTIVLRHRTKKHFLESKEEVGEFLDGLRQEMEAAIERGERIQIK